MKDQADKLRQVIDNIKLKQTENEPQYVKNIKNRKARVIAVTSGKGGVGKTNMTINTAIALSEMGLRVVIIDADFGLANIDVLMGIIPRYSLVDLVRNEKSIFEVLAEGPGNIKFISGGSGVEELVRMEKQQLDKFVESLAMLDTIADIILIDTGAGLSDTVMSFIMAADEVLLVTTPEPTSITDAYALTKMVSNRDRNKIIKVIVNRAESVDEANDILNKLTLVADKFLSLKLNPLGYVLYDHTVVKAVKQQHPFTLYYPKSQAARQIQEISRRLIETHGESLLYQNTGIKGFINKLIGLMNH